MGLKLFPNIHTHMRNLKPVEKQFLKYFDRDYIRLPVNQEKKALVKNWNTYNFNYYKEKRNIKQLLTQYQTYALRTGKRLGNGYYFIVLDLDRNYWGQQIWELGIAWISTKRGGHIYLLLKELPPNGLLFNQEQKRIGEIQSQGKYVIGLGSFHQAGIRYNWERNKASKWWWKFETIKEMEKFLLEKGIFCRFKR